MRLCEKSQRQTVRSVTLHCSASQAGSRFKANSQRRTLSLKSSSQCSGRALPSRRCSVIHLAGALPGGRIGFFASLHGVIFIADRGGLQALLYHGRQCVSRGLLVGKLRLLHARRFCFGPASRYLIPYGGKPLCGLPDHPAAPQASRIFGGHRFAFTRRANTANLANRTAKNGSKKFLCRRKVVDKVAHDARPFHHRPNNDAVRIANALLMEQVLATGQHMNASRLATQIRISMNVLSDLFAMLNKPVRKIERLLFDVKRRAPPYPQGRVKKRLQSHLPYARLIRCRPFDNRSARDSMKKVLAEIPEDDCICIVKQLAKRMNIEHLHIEYVASALYMHNDLANTIKGEFQNAEKRLEKWVNSFKDAYENRISVRQSKISDTKPDKAVNKILTTVLPQLQEEDVACIVNAHRLAMSAENILGVLLEEYIFTRLQEMEKKMKKKWALAWGTTIKTVDFCSSNGDLLQIKNRSNSENSSSKAFREERGLQAWFRTDAKTGEHNWPELCSLLGCSKKALSEEGFQKFIENTLKANPKALPVEDESPYKKYQ